MTRTKLALALIVSLGVIVSLSLGTSTGSADSKGKKDVTFSRDVAPIILNNCVVGMPRNRYGYASHEICFSSYNLFTTEARSHREISRDFMLCSVSRRSLVIMASASAWYHF